MQLVNTRHTRLVQVSVFVVALALVLGLFVDIKPVRAGACGHTFLDSHYCWGGCMDLGVSEACGGEHLYQCAINLFHILANPYSEKYINTNWQQYCLNKYDCPTSCQ